MKTVCTRRRYIIFFLLPFSASINLLLFYYITSRRSCSLEIILLRTHKTMRAAIRPPIRSCWANTFASSVAKCTYRSHLNASQYVMVRGWASAGTRDRWDRHQTTDNQSVCHAEDDVSVHSETKSWWWHYVWRTFETFCWPRRKCILCQIWHFCSRNVSPRGCVKV